MSARTALEPISKGGVGTVSGHRSRTVRSDSHPLPHKDAGEQSAKFGPQQPAQPQITMPPPAPPPGAAFAVALITGQLPPKPTSERELLMRLGSADLPAQGSLALHDRLV